MASTLSFSRVQCVSQRSAASRVIPCPARARAVIARAEDEKYRTGFTDDDSAGQSNIFAVEPKQYVAGTAKDQTTEGSNTLIVGSIAAIVAVVLLGAGLSGIRSNPNTANTIFEDAGKYNTLSYYGKALSK